MEHSDVVTFFHEFGHLLHAILSGRSRWLETSMEGIEFDFIEAPSQMLEEWARRSEGLRRFAKHHSTGALIPEELIKRMEHAQAVGRGLSVRRQIFFAALSLAYYSHDPAGIDTTAIARELNRTYYPVPWHEGTHFQCNFGHLNGYSAAVLHIHVVASHCEESLQQVPRFTIHHGQKDGEAVPTYYPRGCEYPTCFGDGKRLPRAGSKFRCFPNLAK